MKRSMICITLAVVLALAAVCTAAAEQTFTTSYFTLQLPNDWLIETEDLESEEGEECLGYFGGPADIDVSAGVYLVYYENYKDVSLWNLSETELKAYTDDLLEELADAKPELIEIVKAGTIPLILIKGADKEGEFLYAETMTNGYAIEFEFYVTDPEGKVFYPMTDGYIEQIKNILSTLQPAT